MIRIYPSIVAASLFERLECLRKLSTTGIRRIHIDIADTSMTDTITIGIEDALSITAAANSFGLGVDFHLMISEPDKIRSRLPGQSCDCRFFTNLSSINTAKDFLPVIQAVDRERLSEDILDKGKNEAIILLTVPPGRCGQNPDKEWLIKQLEFAKTRTGEYDKLPELIIDGGVSPSLTSEILKTFPGLPLSFVSGSFLFSHGCHNSNLHKTFAQLLPARK